MKVSGSGEPPRLQDVERTRRAARADRAYRRDGAAAGRRISDQIDLSGIESEDLSPRVREAFTQLIEEVQTLRRELDQSSRRIRELEELADLDVLLPIRNRRAFVRELKRMIAFAERYEAPSTMMFIDLNDMKAINDDYGHEAGDAALFHLAQTASDNIRATDVLGRLGGDEFGIILTQADETLGREKAAALAEILMNTPLVLPSGDRLHLQLAYGTYTFSGKVAASEAMEKADKAMYENKVAMKGEDDVR